MYQCMLFMEETWWQTIKNTDYTDKDTEALGQMEKQCSSCRIGYGQRWKAHIDHAWETAVGDKR